MTIVSDAIAEFQADLEQLASFPAAPFGYGRDLACIDDIDPKAQETADSLPQDCYHRLATARGTLPTDPDNPDPDEADFGFDLIGMLHKGLTLAQLRRVEGAIAAELTKDDRIDSVIARVSAAGNAYAISIDITRKSANGDPFRLILTAADSALLLREIYGIAS